MTTEMTKLVSKQPLEVTTLPSHMCVYIFILSMRVDKTQIYIFFSPLPQNSSTNACCYKFDAVPNPKTPLGLYICIYMFCQ